MSQLQDVTVTSPQEALLECSIAHGDPKCTVTWYKNGKELFANKKYDMSVEDDIAQLVVKDTEFKDGATYEVEVKNKLGKSRSECNVTVNCKSWRSYMFTFSGTP